MVILVSNLNAGTTSYSLCRLFARFGNVITGHVLKGHLSSRCHNLGYVIMEKDDVAAYAIRKLNNVLFMHYFIGVKKAELHTPRMSSRLRYRRELYKQIPHSSSNSRFS